MKLNSILILIFCLILGSCKKESTKLNPETSTLTGSWNWVYTSGGIAGMTYTPESTGEIRRIEFGVDSIWKYYVNGVLNSASLYHLVKSKSLFSPDSVLLIKYDLYSIKQNYIIKTSDTLILQDQCFDCYGHLYTRIK
jgi:hypothetical protein